MAAQITGGRTPPDALKAGAGVEHALRSNEDGTPNKAFGDWGRGSRPVVGVSRFDAQHFVGWLNWKTGHDDAYRLLSEAAWEYTARAGTTTPYHWGAKLDHNYGNFGGPGPGLGGRADPEARFTIGWFVARGQHLLASASTVEQGFQGGV